MTSTKSRLLQAQEIALKNGASMYNIQLDDGGSWEETDAKSISFISRQEAVDFCYNLSYITGRKVRLTEGDHRTASGAYIEW